MLLLNIICVVRRSLAPVEGHHSKIWWWWWRQDYIQTAVSTHVTWSCRALSVVLLTSACSVLSSVTAKSSYDSDQLLDRRILLTTAHTHTHRCMQCTGVYRCVYRCIHTCTHTGVCNVQVCTGFLSDPCNM